MCGIAGILDLTGEAGPERLEVVARGMADALRHRGPDEGGTWVDAQAGLALGHRRLSILDLSAAGSQPMVSASGRFVISYNGEIFNWQEVRDELQNSGHNWRGHSDTEVLLEAVAAWGLERAVGRCVGMFAFALWDRQTRELWLVRDRFGKKPLYWTLQGKRLLFGSELRALRAHPDFKPEIDRDALAGFMRRGYFLQPRTIYGGVQQLEPGQMLLVGPEGKPQLRSYWSLATAIEQARRQPFTGSAGEAVDRLAQVLGEAVSRRMVADVPVGGFLSGGYDSSTVVALMQAHATSKVRTFSIGFLEADYDEAGSAGKVARHLGTDHTELLVTAKQARDVIPRLPEIYDEPFADSSQIPTFLVSQLARRDVTVALSGDGGDELFAGYNRYAQGQAVRRSLARLPVPVRQALAAGMSSVSPKAWDAMFQLMPERSRPRHAGEKIHKLADVVAEDDASAYLRLTSQWSDPEALVPGARESPQLGPGPDLALDETERMQFLDTVSYLPGDILTKVDRASMSVSLEVRTPILDHRVAEFAWTLPLEVKIRNGQSKWPLRQLLYRYVPPRLVDRSKSGFGVPIGEWLRGPLKGWAEDLLEERALRQAGILAPAPIRARWREHVEGRRNWQHALWNVLMFESWRRAHA
jgi:asparagine synthase (glutamine-hydrolysing)